MPKLQRNIRALGANDAGGQADHRLEFALKAARMYVWERDLGSNRVERFGDPAAVLGVANGSIDDFLDHVHEDDRERVQRSIDHVLLHAEPYELEFRLFRSDGRLIWVRDVGKRTMTPSGERFVGVCIDITSEVEARETIRHLGLHDTLTGLANRTLLRQRMDDATARLAHGQASLAVLAFDLDGFKQVNDRRGHAAGDQALVKFSRRLAAACGSRATIGRTGGDEFVALLPDTDRAGVERVSAAIKAAMQVPVRVDGEDVQLGTSIGAAIGPDHGIDTESLLHRADLALYASKAQQQQELKFYRPGMDAEAQRRRILESELRLALGRGELSMVYQPLICAQTKRMLGVEALMRWHHSEFGVVPPSEFIEIAEKNGLIISLGNWALRTACEAARQWPALYTAVNISAAHFRDSDFVATVVKILAASQIDPAKLEIEVTETALLADCNHSRLVFKQLKALGISIAIDDFGTGYSSLSYLLSYEFDKIKIDGSFVNQLGQSSGAEAVVKAVLELGTSLGIRTTAECVETSEQMHYLSNSGCAQMQGYLFSAPVSEEAVMLRAQQECALAG